MKAILRGTEEDAIAEFNSSHQTTQGRHPARRRAQQGAHPRAVADARTQHNEYC